MTLDVQNRVPVWPMGRRVPRGDDAKYDMHSVRGDYACPNLVIGGSSTDGPPVGTLENAN